MNLFRDFFRIAAADLPGRGVRRVFSLHGVLLVGASQLGVADCLAGIGFADPGFGKFSVDLFWFVVGLSGLWGGGGGGGGAVWAVSEVESSARLAFRNPAGKLQ